MTGAESPAPIRVLLADDHALVRAGIRELLERDERIQVVAEAQDGQEAWAKLAHTNPDVVVLDIRMPHLNGIELAQRIRQRYPDVGILILTAYDDDPYIVAALQAGANGYVLKTASPKDLIRAVYEVYEGRSVLDPHVAQKLLTRVASEGQPKTTPMLTPREKEILTLVAKGYTNKAIAAQLHISDRTVQGHLAHIYEKLQVQNRTEAVMRALSLGWITLDT